MQENQKLIKNWAGNVRFRPAEIHYPATENEIQSIVLKAANDRKKIRTIGSGHSFSALCKTDQILVSLDHYQGIISVDKESHHATVKGGTKLKALGALLFAEGLAMENLGDIDAQSIAGTISTGTHGTGRQFGTISTQVVGIKIINGKGEILQCSATENYELFKSAQVSLGLLGIIVEVTLQCIPAYKLLIRNEKEALSDVLDTLDKRIQTNRNFEYYWFPYTSTVWTKTTQVAESGEPDKDNIIHYLSELLLENYAFKALCEFARYFPSRNKQVAHILAQFVPTVKKLSLSHRVYATMRLVKFTEMEYNIPAQAYQAVMKDIIKTVNTGKYAIHFPIENRWVKADDIYMSPAFGRDSAYIACHVYHKKDHTAYFKAIEDICKSYGGRPHWGKLNTITEQDLIQMYPKLQLFLSVQKAQDPDGIFLNSYMENLLGYGS